MALTVEDGTGVAGAESYVSVADCADYATARGLTFPVSPENEAEAALRVATAWIDGKYRTRFPGSRTNGRSQGLEWPRTDATDASGEDIAEDEIPVEIISATCEAAIRELASAGSLNPDRVATDGALKRQLDKVGPLETETEYFEGGSASGPIFGTIDDILSSLLGRASSSLFGYSSRR